MSKAVDNLKSFNFLKKYFFKLKKIGNNKNKKKLQICLHFRRMKGEKYLK